MPFFGFAPSDPVEDDEEQWIDPSADLPPYTEAEIDEIERQWEALRR